MLPANLYRKYCQGTERGTLGRLPTRQFPRFLSWCMVFVCSTAYGQTTWYVDPGASETPRTGVNWCAAFATLDEALDVASSTHTIRIATGTYTPSTSGLPEPRDATFQLKDGVTIEGGYAGCGASNPDDRDVVAYETILSGDLSIDDDCATNAPDLSNCCHEDLGRVGCTPSWCDDIVYSLDPLNFCHDPDPDIGAWYENCAILARDNCNCLCLGSTIDYTIDNSYHVITASVAGATTVLDGVTIAAGNAESSPPLLSSGSGAGIYAVNHNVTLNNCTIRDNTAQDHGGGIYVDTGNPALTDCTVRDNSAGLSGGGIYVDTGSPTVTNCSISTNSSGVDGGGIYLLNGSLSVSNGSTITGNTASSDGGGIYAEDSTLTLTSSTFAGNTATFDGGGVFSMGQAGVQAQVSITNCSLTGNTGGSGGGLSLEFSDATVSNTVLDNNHDAGSGSGGGIDLISNCIVTLSSCTVTNNNARNGGGLAIAVNSEITVTGSTISNNSCASSGGGVMIVSASTATFTDCIFDGNSAGTGGAVYSISSNTTINSSSTTNPISVIKKNTASGSGGGVYTVGGSFNISYTLVDNNFANSGGGVYTAKGGGFTIDNCTITNNGEKDSETVTWKGGGVYFGGFESDNQTIRNTLIQGNKAQYGGGVHIRDFFGLLEDCTLADNEASFNGGGLSTDGNAYATINRCKIVNNKADVGGGLHIWAPPTDSSKPVTILDTLVANNTALTSDGGGIWTGNQGFKKLFNCTVANNSALNKGGGLIGGNIDIHNSIFWGNTAGTGLQIEATDLITIQYSDVQFGSAGIGITGSGAVNWLTGNIEAPPLFRDPDGEDGDPADWDDNDYTLDGDASLSPAVDAGDNSIIGHQAVDQGKNPRIANCVVDMGAFEYQPNISDWENPGDPGVVPVIGEDPVLVEFQVPLGSWYQFSFGTRVKLWDSQTNQIFANTVYQATSADPGCELDLRSYLNMQNCFSGDGGGVASGCDAFDSDADMDVDLADYFLVQPQPPGTGTITICNTIPVYVEGITVSTALGDAPVSLMIDHNGFGNFTTEATQLVTVASIDISPSSGGLGTELTITLAPAIPPLAFRADTTLTWTGVYTTSTLPPSVPFTIQFSGCQIQVADLSSANVFVGDGLFANPLPLTELASAPPGLLDGDVALSLSFGLPPLHRYFSFSPTPTFRLVELIDDPLNPDDPPVFGEELLVPVIVPIDDPADPPFLSGIRIAHFAIELCIASDPATASFVPSVFTGDVVTLDASWGMLDSATQVAFFRSNDTAPGCILYRSSPNVPFILVDTAIDVALFPTLDVLMAVPGGALMPVPGVSP